jgi:hypothetical protein
MNPLLEVVGKGANGAPLHIGATGAKVGTTLGFTVKTKVVVVAHCPAAGVKVYVVVALLFKAGDHNPEYPLIEVLGSGASVPPTQIGVTAANVGVIFGFMVIVNVVVTAH